MNSFDLGKNRVNADNVKLYITRVRPYCISVLRYRFFYACFKDVEPRIIERKGCDAESGIETLI